MSPWTAPLTRPRSLLKAEHPRAVGPHPSIHDSGVAPEGGAAVAPPEEGHERAEVPEPKSSYLRVDLPTMYVSGTAPCAWAVVVM